MTLIAFSIEAGCSGRPIIWCHAGRGTTYTASVFSRQVPCGLVDSSWPGAHRSQAQGVGELRSELRQLECQGSLDFLPPSLLFAQELLLPLLELLLALVELMELVELVDREVALLPCRSLSLLGRCGF